MNRLLVFSTITLASVAHADALDRIGEGAPAYAVIRPVALIGALKKLGVGELPAVKQLRAQLGGLDVLDPALLAPSGLDVAASIAGAFFEALPPGRVHHRVVFAVKDKLLFSAFLTGLASGGKVALETVDPATPLGKLGVSSTGKLPDGTVAILRMKDELAIVDAVKAQKPVAPIEIARRVPLEVKKPFVAERGARRLFAPDGAAVAYVDGRKLAALLAGLGEKPAAPNCRDWAKAPATFDDAGLALAVDPDQVKLELAWGTQGGAPLGGLKFAPVDDGAVDASLLSKIAPVMLGLYAASLAPYQSLKHTGAFVSANALGKAFDRCSAAATASLLVRSWPNAIAAGLSESATGGLLSAGRVPLNASLLGELRNVSLALRSFDNKSAAFALSSTFDAAARQVLEPILSLFGGESEPKTIGKHAVTLYHASAAVGSPLVGALETIDGKLALTIADSDDSLAWAFRAATPMPGVKPPAAAPPIFSAHLDGAQVAKLARVFQPNADTTALLDFLARLRRLDADAAADGDLFRLTVRAPVKQ